MKFRIQKITTADIFYGSYLRCLRASDFIQDWWAEVTHGAKNGGSFSEMVGLSDIWVR